MCKTLVPIGGVYAFQSDAFGANLMGGVIPTVKAEKVDACAVLEVPVKEATSKGFQIARGGTTVSTSRQSEAKQEEEESG